jgi:hypothetical protein
MRKPERLDVFYDKLKEIHKQYFCDWRFGQLIYNLLSEIGDPFFYEEDKMIEIIEQYAMKYGKK